MRDGGAVLGVEVGVDFVKEVERGGVALLDGEDEGEGAEAWGWVSRFGSLSQKFLVALKGRYDLIGMGKAKGKERRGDDVLFCPPLSC